MQEMAKVLLKDCSVIRELSLKVRRLLVHAINEYLLQIKHGVIISERDTVAIDSLFFEVETYFIGATPIFRYVRNVDYFKKAGVIYLGILPTAPKAIVDLISELTDPVNRFIIDSTPANTGTDLIFLYRTGTPPCFNN